MRVSGYIFPCVKGKRAVCGDASAQVKASVKALVDAGIQVRNIFLWYDVEAGDQFWNSDKVTLYLILIVLYKLEVKPLSRLGNELFGSQASKYSRLDKTSINSFFFNLEFSNLGV